MTRGESIRVAVAGNEVIGEVSSLVDLFEHGDICLDELQLEQEELDVRVDLIVLD